MYIIQIYGPPASGKSKYAKALAERFDCKITIDRGETEELLKQLAEGLRNDEGRMLILTQLPPFRWVDEVYHINEVKPEAPVGRDQIN